jgi:PAS domain S-box-containing protein
MPTQNRATTHLKSQVSNLKFTMRARLMAAFVLVALLGVGSVGGYSLYQYQRDLHGRVEDQYAGRNQVVTREIEIILNEIRGDLLVAASVPPVQGIVRARDGGGYDQEGESRYDEWVKRLQDIYAAIATAYPRYMQLRFLDEQGNELVRVDWDGQQARPIPPAELQNKADRPYFRETMQLAPGQIYVSPLDLNQERGQIVIPYQPTIRLATPIFNRQGECRGLVILNVLGQAILHRSSTLPKTDGIYAFLADQRGYYLHHSASPEKEWGGPEDLNTGYSLQRDFPQVAGQILSGQAGEVNAGPWAIFYQPIRVDPSPSNFMVLGLAVPSGVIHASVNHFLWFFGAVLLLSLLLAGGMGYYLSARITAPLEALRQSARQIAGGRFDQRVQAGGSVESADLADDFNRMAGQLAELYGSLQAEYQRLFESASDSIFIHDLNGRFLVVNENAAHRLGYTRDELLQMSVQDLDTPEAAARIGANLHLLMERGSLIVESAHQRKDGAPMPVEISATLTEYRGQQAVMSFVRDITERKRAEATLRDALGEAQQRQAEITALLEGSRAVLEYRAFRDAARAIFDSCKNLIGATGGYVALLSEDGTENHVLFLDPGGRPCAVDPALPMPIRGLRGEVYRTGQAAYHNDFAVSNWVELLPAGHVGLVNVLFAPLVLDGKAIGLLGLANKPGGFTENDVRLASAFGDLAAIALRNSRTLESLEQSEAETARRNTALATQNAIAATISQSLDLDAILNAALDKVLAVLEVEAGGLLLVEPDGETLTLRVQRGLAAEFVQAVQRVKVGEGITGQAVAEGKLVVLDMSDYPAWRLSPLVVEEGFQSLLSVPLTSKGIALGALTLGAKKSRAFQQGQLELLAAIGQQIGVAVENARLYQQTQDEMRRAEGLRRIGEAINSTLDLDTLLQAVADQARSLIAADYCEMHFGEVHAGEGESRFSKVFYSGFDPATCPVKLKPSLTGLNGEIFRTQKPLRLDERTRHPRSVPLPEGHPEIGPLLGVPILVGGKFVADILLTRVPGRRPFTEADERAAVTIANQAALAIQNAQLYEQVQVERVEEQATLLRLSREFLAILEPQEIMRRTVEVAAEALHADCSDLMLLDEGNQTLTLGFSRGREPMIGHLQASNTDEIFAGYIVRQKMSVIIEDMASEGRFQIPAFIQECGVVSALGVPVLVGEKAIGALIVDTQRPRLFTAEEAHFLSLIANQSGMAMERARLFEVARRRAGELAAIAEVGGLVTAGGNLQETLDTLAQKIARATGLEAVGIGLYDAAQQTLTYPTLYSTVTVGLLEGRKGTTISLAKAPVLQHLLHAKKYLLLNDPQNDPRVREHQRELCRRDGVQAVLTLPLLFQQELVGSMDLISTTRRAFSPEDISLLTTLADQVAIAIHNARLYGQIEERARELNREVIQQKQYAETVLRSIADGVYSADRNRVVLSWSRGAEAITGYTEDEAIGRACADFLRHTDEAGEVLCDSGRCPFIRVWASGKPVAPEQVFAHSKDGRLVPVAVTAAPIFDEAGQSVGAVEVFRDVAKERELLASIQAASRAKTRFLANVSHELRTPLSGILGVSQALLQGVYGELTPKQAARLGNVHESGQHLLRLINDLLDLARVEEDRLVLDVQPVAVADLCKAAVQMIQPVAEAKTIRVELKPGTGPAVIEGDERRLRQILLNLLSNAVKFTPEGGRIGLATNGDANGVEFTVWDTGIGIAKERQPLLFQPFSQVDDDLARRYQGSGLGLALVKRLTELHGGWVAVESELGRGSRFHVWVPAKRPTPTPDEFAPRTAPSTAQAGVVALAASTADISKRVLIVEDNIQIALLLQDVLEDNGYAVLVAHNGTEGMALARAQAPDLILMDLQLPDLHGVEITRQLKADPATQAIPVVALTALAMPDEREGALAAGLDEYLAKPVDITVLLETVQRWTRRST